MSKINDKHMIRNQLLSMGGRCGALALVASIEPADRRGPAILERSPSARRPGRQIMRDGHEAAQSPAAQGLSESRPLPPIQGHARAHRSAFEQIAKPQPEGVLLGLERRAYLDRHGVGVWAIQPTAVILAVLGVGV